MAKTVKTIGALTSGGDAPGMNAAIRTVVRIGIAKGLFVKGIMRGYAGLLQEEIVDMQGISVSDITHHGRTILYTARCTEFTAPEGQKKGAEICEKYGIDGLVVIGGDGSFRGVGKLSALGTNIIELPRIIDLDIICTDYTIDFDTAMNTAMEVINKVRDISTSHERCSIVEVMGRDAGYLTLWCGIASGVENILLLEHYDGDEQRFIDRIVQNRKHGKKHNIIINAEGIGRSTSMVRRIEVVTGIETRAIILGHMQEDETPICKDCAYASIMGSKAVELLASGQSNRVAVYKGDEYVDFDVQKALAMHKGIPEDRYNISKILTR